jgi:hypothetical protein
MNQQILLLNSKFDLRIIILKVEALFLLHAWYFP